MSEFPQIAGPGDCIDSRRLDILICRVAGFVSAGGIKDQVDLGRFPADRLDVKVEVNRTQMLELYFQNAPVPTRELGKPIIS
jgi:hypothetical protein